MGSSNERLRGAGLALAACALAVGAAAALAQGTAPTAQAPRDDVRVCLVADDEVEMLI